MGRVESRRSLECMYYSIGGQCQGQAAADHNSPEQVPFPSMQSHHGIKLASRFELQGSSCVGNTGASALAEVLASKVWAVRVRVESRRGARHAIRHRRNHLLVAALVAALRRCCPATVTAPITPGGHVTFSGLTSSSGSLSNSCLSPWSISFKKHNSGEDPKFNSKRTCPCHVTVSGLTCSS